MKDLVGNMNFVYSKSKIGYSHEESEKPCQDFSSSYVDPNKTVITCCDGHGSDIYIRSQKGSLFASKALMQCFDSIENSLHRIHDMTEFENHLRLEVLCKWNDLVEEDFKTNKFKKQELIKLSPDKIEKLKNNPYKAYGTTLCGACLVGNKLILVSIGDTESLLVSKGFIFNPFESDDEPVANFTNSMCEEDAYNNIRVKVVNFSKYDGIILCTDGLSAPFQTFDNMERSFVRPLVGNLLLDKSYIHIDNAISEIAMKLGIGDDVSISFIIKGESKLRYYM